MQDFSQSMTEVLSCEKILLTCLRAHRSLCLTVGWPWSGGKRSFTGNLFCSLRYWISSEALGTVMLRELHGTLVTCLICCICTALLSLEEECASFHLRPIWWASWHRINPCAQDTFLNSYNSKLFDSDYVSAVQRRALQCKAGIWLCERLQVAVISPYFWHWLQKVILRQNWTHDMCKEKSKNIPTL